MNDKKSKWFMKIPDANDTIRMFCLPYAGGGASTFYNWQKYFSKQVEIYPIQLPGRENRIAEAAISEMEFLSQWTAYYKFIACL